MCSVRIGDKKTADGKEPGLKSTLANRYKEAGKVKTIKEFEGVFEELPGVSRGEDKQVFTLLK